MHNRAAHYCQGTWGWISWCWQVCSQHTALFSWDILKVCQQRGAIHPCGDGHEKKWDVFEDEMAPGLPASLLWATNQLWGALCSAGFWVHSLSTHIHSLISFWRCWNRNKAAVGTLHSVHAPVSTSGCPEDVDLSVFCIINKILLQPTSFSSGWEEWVSSYQLQIIEIASYCK